MRDNGVARCLTEMRKDKTYNEGGRSRDGGRSNEQRCPRRTKLPVWCVQLPVWCVQCDPTATQSNHDLEHDDKQPFVKMSSTTLHSYTKRRHHLIHNLYSYQ
ncbi:hypothetical protein L484_017704 [Morus notabilis]|uniref:Uncharacterized protein n=1 Tax=Morus notabilis TaxID=981085 RepID=W9SC08_9ROSA|nr:hypothetical protein L484_017704 [Morus notabilis]